MFSEIDKTIFSDSCEVLEIVPSQHYVFPIFKCGSSSLNRTAPAKGWKTIVNEQIAIAPEITVFLRNPRERFISGVNTYIQHCLRDHPELDCRTILFFIKNYLFLNRHYAPQMFWLFNLSRYTQAPLLLRDMKDIKELTHKHSNSNSKLLDSVKDVSGFPWDKLEIYFFLDQLLIDRIGQKITFTEILKDIAGQHPELYKLVFNNAKEIINVLPKT